MIKRLTILILIAASVCGGTLSSQDRNVEWRHGINLFQSTRADVERLLGKPIGENYGVTYKLKDGILYLDYYGFDHCNSRYGFDADWNLPEWTVIELEYLPDTLPKLAGLHLDMSNLRTARLNPETPDLLSYIDDKAGIEYTVGSKGMLNGVRYFPGSRFNDLRCPKK